MTDTLDKLKDTISGRNVFKRHFRKADGRDLYLYGLTPHKGTPLHQDNSEIAKGGELRWHPFRKEWNVYAAHRQNRTFKPSAAKNPLAPSKEGGVPTEIPFSNFEVAIFENKFTSYHLKAPAPQTVKSLDSDQAFGRCEVVVYSPEAEGSLATIGQERRRLLIAAWNDRYETLFNLGCKFVLPFESRGDEVGVTLHHPHGQLYGFAHVPQVQKNTAQTFADGYDLASNLNQWRDDYEVTNAGGMSAFCPPFARFPFETWIAPTNRLPGPWALSEEQLDGFAHLLGEMTRRYDGYFQRSTPYMLSLHAAPVGTDNTFHFTAQFYPILRAPGRVKYLASVEQSTGVFTVDVMPEKAAEILRSQ